MSAKLGARPASSPIAAHTPSGTSLSINLIDAARSRLDATDATLDTVLVRRSVGVKAGALAEADRGDVGVVVWAAMSERGGMFEDGEGVMSGKGIVGCWFCSAWGVGETIVEGGEVDFVAQWIGLCRGHIVVFGLRAGSGGLYE